MAEAHAFSSVKLVCGIISSRETYFRSAEEHLVRIYGPLDHKSQSFDFNLTDYYEKKMGKNLKREFLSFGRLISPDQLSEIKIRTNALEEEIQKEFQEKLRAVNLDPGYLTRAVLVMATAKDFAHRIPLQKGIYAHLEFLFTKTGIRILEWTYPDYKQEACQKFFLDIRKMYLFQLKRPIQE
ncbi:MAG: DUF4416 family protein [Candidatus Aminicenantales bacterium]